MSLWTQSITTSRAESHGAVRLPECEDKIKEATAATSRMPLSRRVYPTTASAAANRRKRWFTGDARINGDQVPAPVMDYRTTE